MYLLFSTNQRCFFVSSICFKRHVGNRICLPLSLVSWQTVFASQSPPLPPLCTVTLLPTPLLLVWFLCLASITAVLSLWHYELSNTLLFKRQPLVFSQTVSSFKIWLLLILGKDIGYEAQKNILNVSNYNAVNKLLFLYKCMCVHTVTGINIFLFFILRLLFFFPANQW